MADGGIVTRARDLLMDAAVIPPVAALEEQGEGAARRVCVYVRAPLDAPTRDQIAAVLFRIPHEIHEVSPSGGPGYLLADRPDCTRNRR